MPLRLDTIIYPDGETWTIIVEVDRPTGTVPENLITWRGEPSSITSDAPELNSETGTVTAYEWMD